MMNRRSHTVIPNSRMEDPRLDPYEFRLACWLSSVADRAMADKVTGRYLAKVLGMSRDKVNKSLDRLVECGIVTVERVVIPQSEGGVRFKIGFNWDAWEPQP